MSLNVHFGMVLFGQDREARPPSLWVKQLTEAVNCKEVAVRDVLAPNKSIAHCIKGFGKGMGLPSGIGIKKKETY